MFGRIMEVGTTIIAGLDKSHAAVGVLGFLVGNASAVAAPETSRKGWKIATYPVVKPYTMIRDKFRNNELAEVELEEKVADGKVA